MRMKVLLRVDGYNWMGLGYVVCLLVLVKMLEEDFEC